jgi:hypothetical protein
MRDMREILLMAKGDAPPARHSVEDIVAAGRLRRRRSFAVRVGGAGAVAAAVATVGVLVSVNLAVSGDHRADTLLAPVVVSTSPTTPAPAPPFTFTFDGYRVGDYRVLAPDEVTLAYQSAGVLRDVKDAKGKVTTRYAGTLTVFQPKMFDPVRFRSGIALTVQGRDAYQAAVQRQMLIGSWDASADRVTAPGDPASTTPKTVTTQVLAWQYATDAWAVLEGELSSDANAFPVTDRLEIAERFAVRTGDPVPAKLPFRTGYLPAGFTLRSVSGQSMTAENRGMVTFVYARPRASTGPLTGTGDRARDRTAPSVVISVLWVDTPPPDAAKRTSRCNAGQHWCMKTLPGGEFYLAVEDPSKTLPDQELLRIADQLTFATIKNTSTWYPAA